MFGWLTSIRHVVTWPVGYVQRAVTGGDAADSDGMRPQTGEELAERLAPLAVPRLSVVHEATAPQRVVHEPAKVPEWQTDVWKARVEAEARKRLKGEIAGVGRFR